VATTSITNPRDGSVGPLATADPIPDVDPPGKPSPSFAKSDTTSGVPSSATAPLMSRPRPLGTWRLVIRSFYFAGAGLGYLFRTQRNARIHGCIAVAVLALAAWLRLSDRMGWALLVVMTTQVLVLEGLNTALEAVVDLASPGRHPLAKVAKDVAAGVVLIAAIGAVIVGLLVLGPLLWRRLLN